MPSPVDILVCRESGTKVRITDSKESLLFLKMTVSSSVFLLIIWKTG